MYTPAKSTVIPNFIVASSPLGLRRLMLLNNSKHGMWFKYDIQFVNGKWYAWYHADVTSDNQDPIMKEATSPTKRVGE
jgi:hypothetical protein